MKDGRYQPIMILSGPLVGKIIAHILVMIFLVFLKNQDLGMKKDFGNENDYENSR